MGLIRNIETNEVVFEDDDPTTVKEEGSRLAADRTEDAPLIYAVEGFDSTELESGEARPYEQPTPPPPDKDRIVINEEENTVTLHGDASAPELDGDYRVIEA